MKTSTDGINHFVWGLILSCSVKVDYDGVYDTSRVMRKPTMWFLNDVAHTVIKTPSKDVLMIEKPNLTLIILMFTHFRFEQFELLNSSNR